MKEILVCYKLRRVPSFRKVIDRFDQAKLPRDDLLKNTLERDFQIPHGEVDRFLSILKTNFNDFGDLRKLIDFKDLQPQFKSAVQKAKKNPIIPLIFTKAAQNIIKEQYDKMMNDPKFIELFLFKLRAFTEELIREGVIIDTMSNRDFRISIGIKMSSWVEE